jgi:hypothetical protein
MKDVRDVQFLNAKFPISRSLDDIDCGKDWSDQQYSNAFAPMVVRFDNVVSISMDERAVQVENALL